MASSGEKRSPGTGGASENEVNTGLETGLEKEIPVCKENEDYGNVVIRTKELTKAYGSLVAVDHLDL